MGILFYYEKVDNSKDEKDEVILHFCINSETLLWSKSNNSLLYNKTNEDFYHVIRLIIQK